MKKYDVYGIGNALVDMEFEVHDEFFGKHGIDKGLMTLVDEDRQATLIHALGDYSLKRQAGGSGANSIVAIAQMGGKCFYSLKVANDASGDFYLEDMESNGVKTNLHDQKRPLGISGKCLVMITKDAERTMNTFLGISATLSKNEVVPQAIIDSKFLYIEGYLVASPTGLEAATYAREIALQNNVKTAITFSDVNMVKFFKSGFEKIYNNTPFDLLFCNESEALAWAETHELVVARERLKNVAKTFVITRGENGAMIFDGDTFIDIEPYKVTAIDSNGAGDMYAGAFLYAITQGHHHALAGKLASLASSKVVAQFGPRLKWHETQEILNQIIRK